MQRFNDLSMILALIQALHSVLVHFNESSLWTNVLKGLLFNKEYFHQLEEWVWIKFQEPV